MSDSRLRWSAFGLTFVLYAAVGYWLQVRHGFIMGDALARVAAAQSVLFSRAPHVAAIGFIFTPLTAAVQIPVVALGPLWPVLVERAFSGTLMSAAFMAGAVFQMLAMGSDRGLPRGYTVTIAALFALNPMIIFYGSNGMSEAPFIFFIVWSVRRLMMWMVDDDVHHLIAAGGIAAGLAYLTRYDAAVVIAAAGFLVAITTFIRAKRSPRFHRALLDMFLVSGPGAATFLGWAVASWLITGMAFAQFSSQYGNAAILAQEGVEKTTPAQAITYSVISASLLAPTLLPLLVGAVVARRRRPYRGLLIAPLVLFSVVLVFQVYTFSKGGTFPFLRYYVIAIPFAAAAALFCVPDGVLRAPTRRGNFALPVVDPPADRVVRRWVYVLPALVLAVCVPVSGFGMMQEKFALQEFPLSTVIAHDPGDVSARGVDARELAAKFDTERQIARYLDKLNLPDSSILADPVYAFAVIAASENPRMFIVPSDPDFVAILNDPVANNVKYMLAVPNTGRGASDALNLRYPALYETGSDVATLDLEIANNDSKDQPVWRLYRVNEPVSTVG